MQRLISLLVAGLLLLAALPALAFTPDDAELSTKLAKEYGGLSSWKVDVSFPAHPGVQASIWQHGLQWRQEWKSIDQPGKAISVGFGGQAAASCPADFPLPLTLFWNLPSPVAKWKALGVDNSTGGFGFHGDFPSYILGADAGEEQKPQVWLNNESMSLLRVRLASGSGYLEFSYSDYTMLGGFDVPGKGNILLPDGESVDFVMEWSLLNKAVDPSLYSVDSIRQKVMTGGCPTPSAPFGLLSGQYSDYPALRE